MSDLTSAEKFRFEKLFGMESGYVIDFSNRTFREFVLDTVGIDIYDEKYDYSTGSKANRLRKFWQEESNLIVGKLLSGLLSHWEDSHLLNQQEIDTAKGELFLECKKIVDRLTGNQEIPLDVYISCSKRDELLVEKIGQRLATHDITYWYVLRNNVVTTDVLKSVNKAIKQCRVVIIIHTTNYNRQKICHSDATIAFEAKKKLIVFSTKYIAYPEALGALYSKAPKEKKKLTIFPIEAWKDDLDTNLNTLIQATLVVLGRSDDQLAHKETLELDYFQKPQLSSTEECRSRILEILNKRFDEGELITLCLQLNIDYENLPATGKINKARELIKYLERRNQLRRLLEWGRKARPDIDWPSDSSCS